MLGFWICDRADALRLPETGFFRNLSPVTKYFHKNPVSRLWLRLPETGLFPNLSPATKYFHKNPVSRLWLRLPETGLFPNLSPATKYFHKNPVSRLWLRLHDIIEKKLFTKGLTNWGEFAKVIRSSERDAAHQT
ncbi:hypothetical protein IQ269_17125 [Tychonema sp. LEGE 07199]|uniref:hypothetical protein n=1 Tax=unclassified Tychonema TaxID=2642144 RepID=UPI0018820C0C|nr:MULTISPECIES: hypothetical protein [unclassified Tychonema]MBE9122475.1 hypothetical protein [Tychonema sp. LEGE 07199]MBE9131884.1 hypothetical protein [Tychonema sp. LEGE 07196]